MGVALLLATPVYAQPGAFDEANFSVTLTGQYSYVSLRDLPDPNIKGIAAEGEFALGAGLHVQGHGGYNYATLPGTHLSNWHAGGSGYWKGQMGRAGVVVTYTGVNLSVLGSAHTTNVGAFGEYFANDNFTFGIKGGGFRGDFDGGYAGIAVTGYVFPDFAVTGGMSYTHLDRIAAETDMTVQGEYLLSHETPFAVFAGYTYSDISDGGGNVSTFIVGLRFYYNTDGFSSLVERQRSGTVGDIGTFGPIGLKF
jgi:hypothetical protein